jgi:hypothetical protein
MRTWSTTTGAIAALFLGSLLVLPMARSRNPVEPHSFNVPFDFMRTPEMPPGVTGHPFHATVTADWNLSGPGGKLFDTEVKGSVWRDAAGDLRVEGEVTRSGGNPVQLPAHNVLYTTENLTGDRMQFSWTSGKTTVLSFRSAHLENSDHFFESLAVPAILHFPRMYVANCRPGRVACVAEPLGERVIGGIRVQGTRYKETIPAASLGASTDLIVTRDVWIDPAMDLVVEIDGTDPLYGNFKMRLSDIAPGTQDQDLFEIPKGYRVVDMTPPPGIPRLSFARP